jgi:antibiotic biosynthesis monooxygenase (ABM) superfamily enzyme
MGAGNEHSRPFLVRPMISTLSRTDSAPKTDSAPAKLISVILVRQGMKDKFLEWNGRVAEAMNDAPGFTSREVIPPQNDDLKEWVFVNRFDSIEHLRAWRDGDARKSLFAEGKSLVEGNFTDLVGDAAAQFHVENSVTEVILEQIAPGKEAAYQKWSNRIVRAQAETPGYQGGYSQPPKTPGGGWMTLMRFASVDDLNNWMNSPIRTALLAEAKDLVATSYSHRVDTSFPGWTPTDASGKAPPNWKASMLVLLGLYPIVCLEILFLGKVLGPMHLNTAVGDFIGNAISVFLTGFGTMPLLCYLLNWWLLPADDAPRSVHFKGTLIVLLVYAITIAIFWKFM